MKYLLLLVFASIQLASCTDVFTDRKISLSNNIYLIYSAGDGYRLAERTGGDFSDIIPSTLSELYSASKNDQNLLVFKAHPLNDAESFLFYSLSFNKQSPQLYQLKEIPEAYYTMATKSMYKIELDRL